MASRPPTVSIDESDFPALFHAADRNSLDGQRRFFTATQLRLVMLVVAVRKRRWPSSELRSAAWYSVGKSDSSMVTVGGRLVMLGQVSTFWNTGFRA